MKKSVERLRYRSAKGSRGVGGLNLSDIVPNHSCECFSMRLSPRLYIHHRVLQGVISNLRRYIFFDSFSIELG